MNDSKSFAGESGGRPFDRSCATRKGLKRKYIHENSLEEFKEGDILVFFVREFYSSFIEDLEKACNDLDIKKKGRSTSDLSNRTVNSLLSIVTPCIPFGPTVVSVVKEFSTIIVENVAYNVTKDRKQRLENLLLTRTMTEERKQKFDRLVIDAACETFSSFGNYLLTPDKGSNLSELKELALHAKSRSIEFLYREGVLTDKNLFEGGSFVDLITKGVILGKSCLKSRFTLEGKSIKMKHLFERIGLIIEKDGAHHCYKSNEDKGVGGLFRYPFPWEEIKIENEYLYKDELVYVSAAHSPKHNNHSAINEMINKEKERIYTEVLQSGTSPKEEEEKRSKVNNLKRQRLVDNFSGREETLQQLAETFAISCPKPANNFFAREEPIQELSDTFKKFSVQAVTGLSIVGLGGIGKTQLVAKYLERYKEQYANIFWLDAEGDLVLDSFKKLAEKLKLQKPYDSDLPSCVYKKILKLSEGEGKKTIIIFDNVDNYDSVKEFLPGQDNDGIHVLITSRYRQWANTRIHVVSLGVFTNKESQEFIKKELGIEHSLCVEELEEKLQGIPLALQQAIAYIKQQKAVDSDFGVKDYLKEYTKYENKVDQLGFELRRSNNDPYTETVMTTWQVTLDKIKNDEKSGNEISRVLSIMAYLRPDNIPSRALVSVIGKNELSDALDLLRKYSMISEGNKTDLSNIHRLVQEVTRIKLKQGEKEKGILINVLKVQKEISGSSVNSHDLLTCVRASVYPDLHEHIRGFVLDLGKERLEESLLELITKKGKKREEKIEYILGNVESQWVEMNKNLMCKILFEAFTKDDGNDQKNLISAFSKHIETIFTNRNIFCFFSCIGALSIGNRNDFLARAESRKNITKIKCEDEFNISITINKETNLRIQITKGFTIGELASFFSDFVIGYNPDERKRKHMFRLCHTNKERSRGTKGSEEYLEEMKVNNSEFKSEISLDLSKPTTNVQSQLNELISKPQTYLYDASTQLHFAEDIANVHYV